MDDKIVLQIRKEVLNRTDLSKELSDKEIEDLVAMVVAEWVHGKGFSLQERSNLIKQVFHSLRRLDVLQEFIEDHAITEIMVNGPHNIFYEKNGHLYKSSKEFSTEEKLMDIIQQIVGRHNRVVNLSSPIVDTRLEDGSRVNIVLPPVAMDGPTISIRKFPEHPLDMEHLIQNNSITPEVADFLKKMVESRFSMFISGGTSSGKTTFLNALTQFIPQGERVITIEDSAELQLIGVSNLVRLETRNANVEELKAITVRDLIRSALRMRPDRIIVGECRGGEAFDMLQAMNTGHDGSLSTGHANSCRDMIGRLETMVLMGMDLPIPAIRQQIVSGIDLIVHLGRLKDKSRRVLEIAEVDGIKDGEIQLNTLYKFQQTGCRNERIEGSLIQVGSMKHQNKKLHPVTGG